MVDPELLRYLSASSDPAGCSDGQWTNRRLLRWGNGLSRWGEDVCARAIIAAISLFPRRGIFGVAFNHNRAFDQWLTEVLPVVEIFLDDPADDEAKSYLAELVDRYLVDCLLSVQPADEKLPRGHHWAHASDWLGVERLAKVSWFKAGTVPQHRVALAIRGISRRTAADHVGDVLKAVAILNGSPNRVLDVVRNEINYLWGDLVR